MTIRSTNLHRLTLVHNKALVVHERSDGQLRVADMDWKWENPIGPKHYYFRGPYVICNRELKVYNKVRESYYGN